VERPEISIVIPAYNAEAFLPTLLAAMDPWLERSDVECLFVDDASTDGTLSLLRKDPRIQVIEGAENRGPGYARNEGVRHARGEVIYFLDADVIPRSDALERVFEWKNAHPDETALIGSYDGSPDVAGLVGQFKNLFHRFVHQNSQESAGTFWTGCGAVHRETFLRHGGFDAEVYPHPSIEDIDFGVRLRQEGCLIRLDKDLEVKHRKDWGLWELVHTDVFRRGIPWTHLCLAYREMNADLNLRWESRLSVLLVASLLVLFLLMMVSAVGPVLGGVVALLMLSLYLFLNRGFFLFMKGQRDLLFSIRCFPLHLLYSFYCGVAFGLGVLSYPWAPIRRRSMASESVQADGG